MSEEKSIKSIFEKMFEEIDKQLDKDREEAKEAADKSKESLKTILKTKVEAEKDISDAIVGMLENISDNCERSAKETIEKSVGGVALFDIESLMEYHSRVSAEARTARDVFDILYEHMNEKVKGLENENTELKAKLYERTETCKNKIECPGKYNENNPICRKGITISASCRACMNRMFWEDNNE